jgi:hypothetical protein
MITKLSSSGLICMLGAALLLCGKPHPASAETSLAATSPGVPLPLSSSEQWALDQIRKGQTIDFGKHCGPPSPVSDDAKPVACRTLPGSFLADLLRGRLLPFAKWPSGTLTLLGADVEGAMDATGAKTDGLLDIERSSFSGPVILNEATIAHSVRLDYDHFASTTDMHLIHIGGDLSVDGSSFLQQFEFDHAAIEGDVTMAKDEFYGGADAVEATVAGFLSMLNAYYAGDMLFGNIHVGESARIQTDIAIGEADNYSATAPFYIDSAVIRNNLYIEGYYSYVGPHDAVSASAVSIGGHIGIVAQILGSVDLHNAKIGDYIDVSSPPPPPGKLGLIGPINASNISVGGDVSLHDANFFGDVDLTGARIAGELNISKAGWYQPSSPDARVMPDTVWRRYAAQGPKLILENARAEMLDDCKPSWPKRYYLSGFVYETLAAPDPSQCASAVTPKWRTVNWLKNDAGGSGDFDAAPYRQYSSVLLSAGDREDANRILYVAQDNALAADWRGGQWTEALRLFVLKCLVGYGIGAYTFIALAWVGFLMAFGAAVLQRSPPAKEKGLLWCLEASLDRLLPIVQLSPEFDEFFKDPAASGLKRWQVTCFAAIAISGWVLGLFLAAAVSGLTANP